MGLVTGHQGEEEQEDTEGEKQATDTEEQNKGEWPRPEQANSFDQEAEDQQDSRELQASFEWIRAEHHGAPFQNFASLSELTLCTTS